MVVNKERYESLLDQLEDLEDKLLYARAAERIQQMKENPDYKTLSSEEVGIDLSDVEFDKDDGWG